MFITNNYSIKEVLTFPFMKDDQGNMREKQAAAEVVDVPPIVQEGIRKPPTDSIRGTEADDLYSAQMR